jgi:hypothetical protein
MTEAEQEDMRGVVGGASEEAKCSISRSINMIELLLEISPNSATHSITPFSSFYPA